MAKKQLILLIITLIGMLFGLMLMIWYDIYLGSKILFSFVIVYVVVSLIRVAIKDYKENEDE